MENSFFISLGAWNWFIIAGVLGVLELLLPGYFVIWYSLAAILVGALALAIDMSWQMQLALYAVMGLGLLLAATRLVAARSGKSDRPLLNRRAQTHLGKVYTLIADTDHGRGSVRVGDSIWQVQIENGQDLAKGDSVLITDIAGTRLIGQPH